ncbi:MAG: NosD domain-containing protein [Candidatus Bipolaricaulia bacterium]
MKRRTGMDKEAVRHMGRKVALAAMMTLIVVLSAGLAGGQVGIGSEGASGFRWWGDHEPIYIYGDDDFTVANGVMSGSGTADDPFVIEGWRIEAPRADYGIYVDHTTKHFVIRDCVVERARIAGIYLNSVRNGVVEKSQISISDTAIYLLNSGRNTIRETVIAECDYGVVMAAGSAENMIAGNSFIGNGLNAKDSMGRNVWCDGTRGNYWSDFEGSDKDGNGIYDVPNYRFGDPCPLVSPPVEWTGVSAGGMTFSGRWVAPDGSLVVTSETPIALSAADPGSGLAEIRYAIDRGEWVVYEGPIYLTGDDGPRVVAYYGIDNLGNAEKTTIVSFTLDNHPPVTTHEFGEPVYVDERGTWVTSKTQITLRRTQESTYGRALTYFRIDGRNWHVYSAPFVLYAADGPHQVSYYTRNDSGVTEELKTIIVFKDDTPPSTRGGRADSTIDVIVGPPEETSPEIVQPLPEPESLPVESAPLPEPESEAVPDVQTPPSNGTG